MRIDEQLELFLTALIEEFQERRPSDLDFSNLVDLSAPTQMYGLTLPAGTGVSCVIHVAHDPSGSSALARVLRFADREDLEAALERRAVTFGGNELPMRDVIPGEWTTDHSILEQAAIELARGAERPIEVEPGRFAVHGQRIVMTDPPGARWTAFYREPLPPLAEALRLLGRAHRSDQPSVTEALVESPRQAAIAAFAEPPLWFGDPPEPTPVETARGQTLTSKIQAWDDDIVATRPISGVDVFVTRKGRVTAVTDDSSLGADLLNQVFAALDRGGIVQLAAGRDDLIEITDLDTHTGAMRGYGSAVSDRNQRMDGIRARTRTMTPYTQLVLLPEDCATQALSIAEACHSDEVNRTRSLRLADARTLREKGHDTEAFIVAWALIENWVEQTFDGFWRGSGKTRSGTPPMQWSAAQRSDLLLAADELTQAEFDAIDKLRRFRNRIVHDLRNAAASDSEECLRVAGTLCQLPACETEGAKTTMFGTIF
jgi:hypothetical protein